MDTQVSKDLIALSELDKQILTFTREKKEIEKRYEFYSHEIDERKKRLEECEAAHKDGKLRQVLEEHRLRDEEQKIVERRKQLADMAGAKVAKILEREIDVASRSLQAMEERTMQAIEEVDELAEELDAQKSALDNLQSEFEDDRSKSDGTLEKLSSEVGNLSKKRKSIIDTLDARLARLYNRVSARYPDGGVAIAKDASCRSCFRALPPQSYNQVLAGNNLIQCPGCSRILVYGGEV